MFLCCFRLEGNLTDGFISRFSINARVPHVLPCTKIMFFFVQRHTVESHRSVWLKLEINHWFDQSIFFPVFYLLYDTSSDMGSNDKWKAPVLSKRPFLEIFYITFILKSETPNILNFADEQQPKRWIWIWKIHYSSKDFVMFMKEVSSARPGWIYWIKNTLKTVKYYYELKHIFSIWLCVKM